MCFTKPYMSDPIVAKALVIWKAIKFRRDSGFKHFIVEGIELKIIHVLWKEETLLESIWTIDR